jgi:hypothetical protein
VGGAYVALAEDTEGAAVNPAAPAVRDAYSTRWFDFDPSLSVSLPGAFTRTDFDNHGDFASLPEHARAADFVDLNVGGTVQFGGLGVAATGDLQQFSLTQSTPGAQELTLQVGRWRADAAYGVADGQIAVGGGARVVTMQIQGSGVGTLLTMTGFAPEVGALLMPTGEQWRVGAAARAPVSAGVLSGDFPAGSVRTAGAFVLPSRVVLPWEVELGVAYQLGPRPLNPGWVNPHAQEAWLREAIDCDRTARARARDAELANLAPQARAARAAELDAEERSLRMIEDARLATEVERIDQVQRARYANWPRERILLLASATIVGASDGAVSLEGFLDQRSETVGRTASVIPRLGMEGEPLRDRMVLRVGTYVEPSRYDGGTPRQHFTFGSDVKLFPLDVFGLFRAPWKLTASLDVAPRYTSAGIGLGMWH